FIISSAGFQSGAFSAAANTNIRLVTWNEFQEKFADRWMETHFPRTLKAEFDRLVDITEPMKVVREAQNLSPDGDKRFIALRETWQELAYFAYRLYRPHGGREITSLPIRSTPLGQTYPDLPAEILDAQSYRGLLDEMVANARRGMAEFSEVFANGV